MSAGVLPVITEATPEIIEVAFKGNRREFFLWDQGDPPPFGTAVIVDADRGEDLGRVHATGTAAKGRCERCAHGLGTAQPQRRVMRHLEELRHLKPDKLLRRRREKFLRMGQFSE